MKTFGEILSAIKNEDLANAIMSNVFTSEADMAHFQACIIDSLNDLAHIVPINNANPPILWPFVQNESVAINVVHIHTESIFGKYDALVKITCAPLIEHLAEREEKESKKERLASFLGMHVNTDCIGEKDLLPFVANVLYNILPDDIVFADLLNCEVPKEEQSKLTRYRLHNFELFFDTYSKLLTPGYDGRWQYSTAGRSCACSWTWSNGATGCKKDLKGKVFGGGLLLALDASPRCVNERWEWLCQCKIHDVPPKYFRISKLESNTIKGCGCHGGSRYHKDNDDLIGVQIGFIKVLRESRINGNRPEFKVRCIVCGREKWVRAENLRKHIGISCHCAPSLKCRTIGKYYVLDSAGRRNEDGFPEALCEKENGDEVWVLTEKLLRMQAEEVRKKMKAQNAKV